MDNQIKQEKLINLFNKPFGANTPTKEQWAEYYDKDVIFIDPTQIKYGLESYVESQEKLVKRCDDISLETHSIAFTPKVAFIEWTMILKIMKKEFIYPGTSRLIFGENGKIKEHRDYFDFCGPTFGPIPIIGSFLRWLYNKFVN